MVQLLLSPVPIIMKCSGYTCKDQFNASRVHILKNPCQGFGCWSYIGLEKKSNRRCANIIGQNCLVIDGLHFYSGIVHFRMPRRVAMATSVGNFSIKNKNVGSFKNEFVRKEKDKIDVEIMKHELPPWGRIKDNTEFQCDIYNQTLMNPDEKVVKTTNKLYLLEETDEEVLSMRILKLSRSNKLVSALNLFKSMEVSGLRPNLHACNSLLSCLLRNQMLDEALRIFEFMKKCEMTTGHTYSLILKAVANVWGCNAAVDIFEGLLGNSNLKKQFDAVVYNTMLTIYGKVNDWVQTERIWRILKDNDHTGTTVTYRLLVCIFVRCSQYELALDAYHEMIRNGVEPTDDAMQAIIGACCKEGEWEMALSVFQNMLNQGLKPSAVACNALINSLGKASKANLALKVYSTMKSLGHVPDAYTWNAILGALYRANEHADVLQFFQRIQARKDSEINVHMYNTALMSCKRLGSWNRALQLIWQMEGSGLHISTMSYNLVIGTCEVARRPHIALQVYERMLHQNHTPDLFTQLSLIRSCIWGSLWDEMEQLLDQVPPNASLYNAAIQGMFLRGKIDSAKNLYNKMQVNGFEPDGKTRAFMLQNMRKHSVRRPRRRSLTRS